MERIDSSIYLRVSCFVGKRKHFDFGNAEFFQISEDFSPTSRWFTLKNMTMIHSDK